MDVEDLFGLIVWVIIIVASISSKQKKKAKQADRRAKQAKANPWEQVLQNASGQTAQTIRQAVEAASAKKSATPVQTAVQMSMLPPLTSDAPAAALTPLTPMVHTHVKPDCEVHDASGSLAYASTEGKDPCHEAPTAAPAETTAPAQEHPGLALDFTGDNLMRAFVMQEVLTRPCDRRPRGYARS